MRHKLPIAAAIAILASIPLGSCLINDCSATLIYYCSECASTRGDWFICTPLGLSTPTLSSRIKPSAFTPWVTEAYPGSCRHSWVCRMGGGIHYGCALGKRERWRLLENLHECGRLKAAHDLNPRYSADLIRFVLSHDIRDMAEWDLIHEDVRFDSQKRQYTSPQDYEDWFNDLKKAERIYR